jgi:hypothetical protein
MLLTAFAVGKRFPSHVKMEHWPTQYQTVSKNKEQIRQLLKLIIFKNLGPNTLICAMGTMGDYLSVKSLLPKNCTTISSRNKKCEHTTHFCRCSTDKEEIIPTTSSCLARPQVPPPEQCSGLNTPPPAVECAPPSQAQCFDLYPPPPAPTCAPPPLHAECTPPSEEQCSNLYPPPPPPSSPTCAPPPVQVECATPEPRPEAPTCAPCPSQETVSFINSPTTEMFDPRQEMETHSSEEMESSQTSITDDRNNSLISYINETLEIVQDEGDFIGQFVNRIMKEKKDFLILILCVLNIVQCAVIVFCEICRVCGRGEKKDAHLDQDAEQDGTDSFAMDKRTTCEASEYMLPIVELNAGNFSQIEAGAQLEQVQVLAILDESQQYNKSYF